ncbi:MAG: acetate/propionate family kinase [Pseudomonadota bacterium]
MSGDAILTLNAGSSSIKFSVYAAGAEPALDMVGQVEAIGAEGARLKASRGERATEREIGAADHAQALAAILEEIEPALDGRRVAGVGHRIAHGGVAFAAPRTLEPETLEALRKLEPFAPLHQPHNLAAVEAATAAFPEALQIGCFDTAFHRGHPWVNDVFALPRRFYEEGVRRYGFHGLSYEYVSGALAAADPTLAEGRVVIAHLGNGASMCALHGGRSVASTMGFSALDGLPMGTRCGQLDPGVLLYLMAQKGMSAEEIERLLYRESGLKGLSGLSNDMRALETAGTEEAEQAIAYFVFRIRREIGAMAAVLGGLDALVFCGGIGENARGVRARVCAGMDWLGLALDPKRNDANARDVATTDSRVRVLVIPTDEERVIARAVNAALG